MTFTADGYTPNQDFNFSLEADSQKAAFHSIREVVESHHPDFRLVKVCQEGVGPSIGRIHPTR